MRSKTRQISLRECYEILGLEKGATLADVKHAYRRRAFELHPDLNPGNAESSRQFQLLNEAYVALSAMLKPAEEARQRAEKAREAAGGADASADSGAGKSAEGGEAPSGADKKAQEASAAYAEQDVLRDLLNDPFARRVFEDIYSELNQRKTEAPPREEAKQEKPRERKEPEKVVIRPAPAHKPSPQEKGVKGAVKGAVRDWLRRQIDDEQSFTLPAARLAPGCRVRLQIRRGISDETSTVEVTLPPDFKVGKPMRLKGLGKRVGPWQGDLYLTLYTA